MKTVCAELSKCVLLWSLLDISVAQKTKRWKCMAPQGCPCYT